MTWAGDRGLHFDTNKNEVAQKAKVVVLSANGMETPRLLLLSKSARFPDGLANASGLVGKYLMGGNVTHTYGLFEHPLNEYKGIVCGAEFSIMSQRIPNGVSIGGGRITGRGTGTGDANSIRASRSARSAVE